MTLTNTLSPTSDTPPIMLARHAHMVAPRHALLAIGLLSALVLLTLTTRLLPCCGESTPVTSDTLAVRVHYERALVADAEYQLALRPRIFTVGQWQIAVQPRRLDPQRAFDDAVHIEILAFDQPEVLTDVWRVRLAYQRLDHISSLYRQAQMTYTPDYAQVQTWLDDIDTTLDPILPDRRKRAGRSPQGFPQVGWN